VVFPAEVADQSPAQRAHPCTPACVALLLTKTKFAIRQEFQNGSRLFEAIHSRHDNSSHYTIGTKVLRGRYCLVSIIGNPDVVAATWVMKSLSKKVWRIPMLTHRSKYLRILPQRNWKITAIRDERREKTGLGNSHPGLKYYSVQFAGNHYTADCS
jgi:hypothetical protein